MVTTAAPSVSRRQSTDRRFDSASIMGFPAVDAVLWFAALVPAGTPPAIIKKLNSDLTQAISDPEIKKALALRGLEVRTNTPEELGAFLEKDYLKFRDLIQKLGLKVD